MLQWCVATQVVAQGQSSLYHNILSQLPMTLQAIYIVKGINIKE